jgi:hypothetical protein
MDNLLKRENERWRIVDQLGNPVGHYDLNTQAHAEEILVYKYHSRGLPYRVESFTISQGNPGGVQPKE